MPINLNDPRVRKTRRSLQNAFIQLIMKQGYDSISIQDIANEAETARITFYRHYKDKEELLTDCLNALYDELVEKTEAAIHAGAPRTATPLRTFYEHLDEKEDLYRVLFSGMGSYTVISRMTTYMVEKTRGELKRLALTPSSIPLDICAYHLVSANIGLGVWWLENGKPHTIDYMTQRSLTLSLQGIAHIFNGGDVTTLIP
jgi:AcrR family transcriptional regulator